MFSCLVGAEADGVNRGRNQGPNYTDKTFNAHVNAKLRHATKSIANLAVQERRGVGEGDNLILGVAVLG